MRQAVLPSLHLVQSGLALPAPLAFNLSLAAGNQSQLVLDSCTVDTSCDNLLQFQQWWQGDPGNPLDGPVQQVGSRGPFSNPGSCCVCSPAHNT